MAVNPDQLTDPRYVVARIGEIAGAEVSVHLPTGGYLKRPLVELHRKRTAAETMTAGEAAALAALLQVASALATREEPPSRG